MTDHPAVFPDGIVELAREAIVELPYPRRVLDPFAGVGNVHKLGDVNTTTYAVELMPKWADDAAKLAQEIGYRGETFQGDATALRFPDGVFDAVFTSPCYGNRMADHHNNADACKACLGAGYLYGRVTCPTCKGSGLSHRRSYRHYYGDGFFDDAPIECNAGAMQWGDEYRALHCSAWAEVHRVLRPGGRFILNVKDHIRDGKRVRVSRWHHETAIALGFEDLWRWDVPLDGYGMGANREARVPTEQVYVMEKP